MRNLSRSEGVLCVMERQLQSTDRLAVLWTRVLTNRSVGVYRAGLRLLCYLLVPLRRHDTFRNGES